MRDESAPPGDTPSPPPSPQPGGGVRREEARLEADVEAAIGLRAGEKTNEVEIEEKRDRFRTYVAIAIAVVSILGALVAFRGSLAEQDSRALEQQGIQEAAQREQILTEIEAKIDSDIRYVGQYQEHLKAAASLDSQATAATSHGSSALAQNLSAQAADERVVAHTISSFFQADFPIDPGTGKPLTYDRAAATALREAEDSELPNLHPNETIDHAEALAGKAVDLVGLVTLFVGSLLFLTLAQFTRPSIRRLFAAAGGAFALAASVLWIVVERTVT